jgi:predicted amidohydrolase YtcJ
VGDARVDRFDPFRDAIDAGALVIAGSDWEVVPSVNPWPAIETLVTRQLPGGSEKTIAPSQRVSLKEAVDIFTVNAATQMQHRDQVGSIEPGLLADLVVIDRNPFKVPITEVGATQVKMTLIGGEVVYTKP